MSFESFSNELKKKIVPKNWLIKLEDASFLFKKRLNKKASKDEIKKIDEMESIVNKNAIISMVLGTVFNIASFKIFPTKRGIKSVKNTILDIVFILSFLGASGIYSISQIQPQIDSLKKDLIDACDKEYLAQMKKLEK